MKKEEQYLKKEFNDFISLFKKIDIKYLYVMLYDILFIALLYFGVTIWNKFLTAKADVLQSLQGLQFNEVATDALLGDIRGFVIFAIVSIILLLLYIIIVLSISQGLVWNTIFQKKLNLQFFKKFILLNLLCIPFYIILLTLVSSVLIKLTNSLILVVSTFTVSTVPVMIIVTLFSILIIGPISLYFLNIINMVYIDYMKNNKILKSIGVTFKILFNRGHLLYVPYVLLMVFITLASSVLLIFRLAPQLYAVVSVIFLLFSAALVRFYLKDLIHKIK